MRSKNCYVTGDTHGTTDVIGLQDFVASGIADKETLLLVAGDLILHDETEKREVFDFWEKMPFTVAFIDGNHDDYKRLAAYEEVAWNGGRAGCIRKNLFHLRRGGFYTFDDFTLFALGGARSESTLPQIDANNDFVWPEEIPSPAQVSLAWENLRLANWNVDVVLTHDGPQFLVGWRLNDPVRPMLEEIHKKIFFRRWYYGHHHRDIEVGANVRCVYNDVIPIL